MGFGGRWRPTTDRLMTPSQRLNHSPSLTPTTSLGSPLECEVNTTRLSEYAAPQTSHRPPPPEAKRLYSQMKG